MLLYDTCSIPSESSREMRAGVVVTEGLIATRWMENGRRPIHGTWVAVIATDMRSGVGVWITDSVQRLS